MLTVVLFVVILAVLVFVHEAGHFVAAKLNGVRVHEFGFGFPPRIWAVRRGETEYSVNLLPLGGFVRIAGEDGFDDGTEPRRSFVGKAFLPKLAMLSAGVAVNWVLAAGILGSLQIAGSPIAVSDSDQSAARITISAVADASPAKDAGLAAGDVIVKIAAAEETVMPVRIQEVQDFLRAHGDENVTLTILRGESTRDVATVPRVHPPEGQGALGVALLRVATVRHPWYEAPWRGFFVAASVTIGIVSGFVGIVHGLFVSGHLQEGVTGPIGIAKATGQVWSLGLTALFGFIAALSLNLAVLNAIPFPALDGGRAAVVALETLLSRRFPLRIVSWLHAAGFAALMVFVLLITYRDVQHLF